MGNKYRTYRREYRSLYISMDFGYFGDCLLGDIDDVHESSVYFVGGVLDGVYPSGLRPNIGRRL